MKPILIFGASVSAAAMAAGFAVLADQAMPRRAADADPVRPAPVARAAPDLARIARHEAPRIAAPQASAPLEPEIEPEILSRGLPAPAADLRMSLLPVPAPAAKPRPAPRRVPPPTAIVTAQTTDPAPPGFGRIEAARFEYIPLIGVYR